MFLIWWLLTSEIIKKIFSGKKKEVLYSHSSIDAFDALVKVKKWCAESENTDTDSDMSSDDWHL